MKPPVISIVSKKRSGKTTLLEKLIPELKRRGYRVGTVKHDTHGFDIDHEGKDTWRHKQAGAEAVVISSPWKISVIKDVAEEAGLGQIVATQLSDMDIVLTEGYKSAGMPQVEVSSAPPTSAPCTTNRIRARWWPLCQTWTWTSACPGSTSTTFPPWRISSKPGFSITPLHHNLFRNKTCFVAISG